MKEAPIHQAEMQKKGTNESVIFERRPHLQKSSAMIERQWLRTIHFSSFEEAKRFALLATGSSVKEVSKTLPLSKKVAETNSKKTSLAVTNLLIEATSLNPQGKAAQLFRLKAQGIEPMDAEQFTMSSAGRDVQYLRTLRGATQKEAEKALKRDIGGIEANAKNSSENFENAFFDWLEIPNDHVIARIMRIKRKGLIPTERIHEISKELKEQKYLFKEHLVYIRPERIAKEDKSLLDHIQARELRTSEIVAMLRGKKELSREELAERSGISTMSIRSIEEGWRVPWSHKTVQLAQALGYDIHHPLTKELLSISDKERMAKRKPQ